MTFTNYDNATKHPSDGSNEQNKTNKTEAYQFTIHPGFQKYIKSATPCIKYLALHHHIAPIITVCILSQSGSVAPVSTLILAAELR
jgi:hypothetical protein